MRISDARSDVCSSDLLLRAGAAQQGLQRAGGQLWRDRAGDTGEPGGADRPAGDRKSVVQGKSVSVRVDLGGRRIINKNQIHYRDAYITYIPYPTPIKSQSSHSSRVSEQHYTTK